LLYSSTYTSGFRGYIADPSCPSSFHLGPSWTHILEFAVRLTQSLFNSYLGFPPFIKSCFGRNCVSPLNQQWRGGIDFKCIYYLLSPTPILTVNSRPVLSCVQCRWTIRWRYPIPLEHSSPRTAGLGSSPPLFQTVFRL